MKNLFLKPTENSSKLSYNKDGVLELNRLQWRKNTQNIYITNDEKIKEGDWCYDEFLLSVFQANCIMGVKTKKTSSKIILTTDPDLIKDGIQAIPDEFLEWFVKNPSCESVETYLVPKNDFSYKYRIIIPEENPDLEEYIRLVEKYTSPKQEQDKKLYSEEDFLKFSEWVSHNDWVYLPSKAYWVNEEQEELEQKFTTKELFEQFKKK
jgi:hypothetical protein